MGMSYRDYWDGDNTMVRYYRRKYELDRDKKNFEMWLQGAYIYEALLKVAPAFNAFTKNHNVQTYRERPIPLTEAEAERQEDEKSKRIMEANRAAMEAAAISFNKRLKEKKGEIPKDGD